MPTNPAELLGGAPWWLSGALTTGKPAELLGFYSPPPTPTPPLPVVANVPRGTPALQNLPIAIGTAQDPNPYGVDIRCVDDLDPYFPLIGGIEVLAQDLYHAITCGPGSVIGQPNTLNVRSLLSQGITQADLQTIQSSMTATLQDDERVQQALVTASYDTGTQSLTVKAVVLPLNPQLSTQPFQFIASISVIGSALLSISPVGS
jgi:hypothetical protein